MSSMNYYAILNIPKNATKEDIKLAFNTLSKKYHPDRMNGDDTLYKSITEAYSVLKNKDRRRNYDESLVGIDSCKDSFRDFQEHNNPENLSEEEYSRRLKLLRTFPIENKNYSLYHFMKLVAEESMNSEITIPEFFFGIAEKLESLETSEQEIIDTENLFRTITSDLIPHKDIDIEQLLLEREQTLFEVDYKLEDWNMEAEAMEPDVSIRSKFDSMMAQRDTDMNSFQMLQQKILETNTEWDENNVYNGLTSNLLDEDDNKFAKFSNL